MKGAAEKIRSYAKSQDVFTLEDLRKALSLSADSVRWSVNDFIKRGEIIRTENGLAYNSEFKKARRGYLIYQITKAMRVCGSFTVDEVVMLTSADPTLVRRIARECIHKGLLEIEHKKRQGISPIPVYRVTDSDRFKKEAL
ncbi:hypothetical protein [Geovibrio ferrireducens]|uniref:hypothetical protein n=1 Tax=Geovibrio ferrireducens TaxID=46201 RepID=UPI0022464C44|nr:hypothetical protein [Geovibrio ferrireducens]